MEKQVLHCVWKCCPCVIKVWRSVSQKVSPFSPVSPFRAVPAKTIMGNRDPMSTLQESENKSGHINVPRPTQYIIIDFKEALCCLWAFYGSSALPEKPNTDWFGRLQAARVITVKCHHTISHLLYLITFHFGGFLLSLLFIRIRKHIMRSMENFSVSSTTRLRFPCSCISYR